MKKSKMVVTLALLTSVGLVGCQKNDTAKLNELQKSIEEKDKKISELTEKLKEAGAKRVLPLKVSGAFHSGLMKEAGEKLSKVLDGVEIRDIQIPYVANINAEIVTDKNEIKKNLIDQVSGSVHLEQSIRKMIEWGVDTFIEIGPGKTMAGFVKKIDAQVKMFNIEEYADVASVCSQILEAK